MTAVASSKAMREDAIAIRSWARDTMEKKFSRRQFFGLSATAAVAAGAAGLAGCAPAAPAESELGGRDRHRCADPCGQHRPGRVRAQLHGRARGSRRGGRDLRDRRARHRTGPVRLRCRQGRGRAGRQGHRRREVPGAGRRLHGRRLRRHRLEDPEGSRHRVGRARTSSSTSS